MGLIKHGTLLQGAEFWFSRLNRKLSVFVVLLLTLAAKPSLLLTFLPGTTLLWVPKTPFLDTVNLPAGFLAYSLILLIHSSPQCQKTEMPIQLCLFPTENPPMTPLYPQDKLQVPQHAHPERGHGLALPLSPPQFSFLISGISAPEMLNWFTGTSPALLLHQEYTFGSLHK